MRRGRPERLVISPLYKELPGRQSSGRAHRLRCLQPTVALNGVFTRYAHALRFRIYSVARARPHVNDTDPAHPAPVPQPRCSARSASGRLIEQAAGMSTRQVAGLLATAAPKVMPPRDTLRAVAPDRFTLKVSLDQECEQGLRLLKDLLSHHRPRMSWGDLAAAANRNPPRRPIPAVVRRYIWLRVCSAAATTALVTESPTRRDRCRQSGRRR